MEVALCMLKRLFTYRLLFLPYLFIAINSHAQLGAPVYNQDFGLGNEDPNTIGAAFPANRSSFAFSNSLCPPPGSYTIARRINVKGCFGNKWISLSSDYTSDHIFGMDLSNMMIVNNDGVAKPRIVYMDTVNKGLCAGTKFEFSTAFINIDYPANCQPFPSFPYFVLAVEDDIGNTIINDTIKGIPYANPPEYGFTRTAVNFTMPAGVSKLVLKVILLGETVFNGCGSDFAIDDVVLSAAGPAVKIAFDNLPASQIVASACFQQNKTFSMSGNMGAYYTNPQLQWQQSTDKGNTWTDIPGATSGTYSNTFSTPDTFLFRLSGGEAANIANPNCRVISNTITVAVDGIPANFQVSSNSPVCAGQDLKFNATGGSSYRWSGPNGFADDVYYAHIYHSVRADSGMYYVDIVSPGGCRARDSVHVTIIGTDLFASADTAICNGRAVQLHSTPGAISYQWAPPEGLSSTIIPNPIASPQETTVYTVKITDADGCLAATTVTLRVVNKIAVKAIIDGTGNICRYYDSAMFKSNSSGTIKSWNWNFGNGQTSVLMNPPVQYFSSTGNEASFTVQLAIKDTSGCTDTAYHVLKLANNCFIAVPSAFTPNGDGSNDYLYPLNTYKASHLVFRVFNRSGQLVFEGKDRSKKWDGSVGGNPQPEGAYVWMLEYTDAAGKKISLRGTSVLIR